VTERDIAIWNECVQELSPKGQQEADIVLRRFTKNLRKHTEEYKRKRRKKNPNGNKGTIIGVGKTGAKELIIVLIKAGYL